MAKNPLDLKHVKSVRVIALQDLETNEIAGKIVANFSDNGVCTAQAFIHTGKLSQWQMKPVSCGGAGYDKLNSCLADMFYWQCFENWSEVKDLEAGLLNKWFESHGYKATVLV